MSYDVEMDPYQDGPKTSTIISLLAALCIFGGLYIIIPKYFDKAPIVETTSVVADLNDEVNPIPVREHEAQALTRNTSISTFDTLFSRVEKNMQLEHCVRFAQLDYTRAWLLMCEKKSSVSESCTAALAQSAQSSGPALTQSLNTAMGTVCGCTLTQQEARAVEDMLKRSNKQCEQKYQAR